MLRRLKMIVRGVVRDELERARAQQIADATEAAKGAIEHARPQQIDDAAEAAKGAIARARPQQIADATEAAKGAIARARPQQIADAAEAAKCAIEHARPQQIADAAEAAKGAIEHARPQQIDDAAEAAKGAIEGSFVDLGGLPQVRRVVALGGELVDTGLLDRLRAMSVAPIVSLDVIEKRSKLATQQAVACAFKEIATLKDSTDRIEKRSKLATQQAVACAFKEIATLKDSIEKRSKLATQQAVACAFKEIATLKDSTDRIEKRSKLATLQAVACAFQEIATLKVSTDRLVQHLPATQQAVASALKEIATLKDSTDRLVQHLPGFVNAMASVPALANLIRQQRLEIDALKAASETQVDFGARYQIEIDALKAASETQVDFRARYQIEMDEINARIANAQTQAASDIDRLQSSVRGEVLDVFGKLTTIEACVADNNDLLLSKFEANRNALDQAVVEQRKLWEAMAENKADAGNLWKSAELATREIGNLWQRTEFNRSEILYEMKYSFDGGRTLADRAIASGEQSSAVEPKIRNPKLIDEAPPEGFKVNLGCGHIARAGYVNVDARSLPGVDVVADLNDLPFSKKTVNEIFSAHVLEHFPQEKLKRLLPYWRSLLKPGGRFCAVVPDGEASLAGVADGNYSFADFREVLFGGQEYEGDFHFNLFTPDSLADLLRAAKFKNIQIIEKARRNGNCFEFEIGAEA